MPFHISKATLIQLTLLMLLGLALRLIHFEHTTFGYDQARDGFMALEIFGKDPVKLIGPSTDIRGLFHGSLYWYIIAPAYKLFNGDPLPVKLYHTILHLGMIPLSYFIALHFTKKKSYALLTAALMTFSIEAIQYARWMSNPSFALYSVSLFFYGLWNVINKKSWGFGLMIVMWAISVQLQLFLIYLFPFIAFAFYLLWRGKKVKDIFLPVNLVMIFGAGILFLPFIASEIKFNFQGSTSLLGYFKDKSASEGPSFFDKIVKFMVSLRKNVYYNIFGFNELIAKLLLITGVAALLYSIKYKADLYKEKLFLLIWACAPIIIYPIESNNAYFLNIGNLLPLLLLTVILLHELSEKLSSKYRMPFLTIAFAIILLSNLRFTTTLNQQGESLFSVQNGVDLYQEKHIIDWMYDDAQGKQFSFNTLTNPLFINTTWAYMFDTYARKEYGTLPDWTGDPIDGRYAGSEVMFPEDGLKVGNTLYLIIEPGPGIPDNYLFAYYIFENKRSRFVEEKHFGEFIVQKRIITEVHHFSKDDIFEIALALGR
jgi:hypothetical protein